MSDKESDSDQQCQAKKRKLDEIENQNQNQNELAVVGPSNIESPSSGIFKMDIDCFEELFEWLSLDDLRTLRHTSKRFKKIVDYYIGTNYPRIGKFKLNDENFDMFRQMDSSTIRWIREIDVSVGSDFDGTQFSSIDKILNNVKKITIIEWETDPDFYNCFLKYCKNVKCLLFKEEHLPYINISNEWLNHQYPSIEYLRIDNILKSEIDDFVKIFHLNPNIHAVSIGLECLNVIGSHLIAAGIKFDRFYTIEFFIEEEHQDSLKQLYDAGFYKRLCLNTGFMDSETVNRHSKLALVGTEVLGIRHLDFKIPSLPNLKELNISDELFDIVKKYKNVRNTLERFYCSSIHSYAFLELIRKFPKLKHCKIFMFEDTNKLNLIAMNKERQKLAGAYKTIIYVPDNVFLATKWASTKINLNLIELKRIHACDWNRFFENDCGICRP